MSQFFLINAIILKFHLYQIDIYVNKFAGRNKIALSCATKLKHTTETYVQFFAMRFLITALGLFLITASSFAFAETGLASVYSSAFQGSKTANGEIYNNDDLTAAHRSLPFGSLVRITRVDDGRSVIVRINDRGPFVNDHITDLSRGAAIKLGIKNESDVVAVQVELLRNNNDAHFISNSTLEPAIGSEEVYSKTAVSSTVKHTSNSAKRKTEKNIKTVVTSKSVPTSYNITQKKSNNKTASANLNVGLYKSESKINLKGKFAIQVASIANQENVEKTVNNFRKQNCSNVFVQIVADKTDKPLYKILLGTFSSQKSAEIFMKNNKCCRIMKAFVVGL